MLMVCPHCASNNIITIKGVGFCVNCGHSLAKTTASAVSAPKPATKPAQPVPVTTGSTKIEIKNRHQISSRQATVSAPPKARPAVAAAPPKARQISDISRPKAAAVPIKPAPKPIRPAVTPVTAPARPKATPISRPTKPTPAEHHHSHRSSQPAVKPLSRSHIVTASSLATGLLAALGTAKLYLIIHASHVSTPGGFFHYLATRSTHSKLLLVALLPAALVITLAIVAIWTRLRAAAIYAASRLYDHRPVGRTAANRAGLNALGPLLGLTALAVLSFVVWLFGLVGAVRSLGLLSLESWQVTVAGIAVSFAMVLIGLWLAAGISLAGYVMVLSGRKLGQSLSDGLHLVSRDYVNNAVTALGLALTFGAILLTVAAGFIGLTGNFDLPVWVVAGAGGVFSAVLFAWFSQFSLNHWVRRYRSSVKRVYGSDKATLYLAGRQPKPVSRVGLALVISWWLAVAAGGGWLLWHFQVNPSGLLNGLSATIY